MLAFDASSYCLKFPFFQQNGETYLPVIGRNKEFAEIIKHVDSLFIDQKYSPIILTGSRGIGKTFLLKKVGMQDDPLLANEKLSRSKACGRVLSFDCFNDHEIPLELRHFFPYLMIYFICDMFNGQNVDGIDFFRAGSIRDIENHQGEQTKFNSWIKSWRTQSVDNMTEEFIRLTNIAFGVNYDRNLAPLVILLDEVQHWSDETSFISNHGAKPRNHTILS